MFTLCYVNLVVTPVNVGGFTWTAAPVTNRDGNITSESAKKKRSQFETTVDRKPVDN